MASLILTGDTSGQVTIAAPAVAGTNTLTLQAATATSSVNTLSTAVASTSGTSIDFTGLPAWVKRITVMFSAVSTNGSSLLLVRLGTSGGIVSSGYDSTANAGTAGGQYQNITNAFCITYAVASSSKTKGAIVLTNLSGNTWIEAGLTSDSVSNLINTMSSGEVTLSGALTQVRITTVNGTDTFDAGSVNILYEG